MFFIVGDSIKMVLSWEVIFLRFFIKLFYLKGNLLYLFCFIFLVFFKEIKVGIFYMDGKRLYFFSFIFIVYGKMYFSYENIWKECF